jgi:hypothetical protein
MITFYVENIGKAEYLRKGTGIWIFGQTEVGAGTWAAE